MANSLTEWVPSHWYLVLGAGLAFLITQLAFCFSFCWRNRRYERAIVGLIRDLDAGGNGRDHDSLHGLTWLSWVDAIFPPGTSTPGNYTRENVLEEFDTRISSASDYLLLQRLGIMAPLLGVMLTVFGFPFLEFNDEALSGKQIIEAVTPLVAGVGTGAILAMINQGLLHVAGGKAEKLRNAARTWFDRAIWSSVGLDSQAATVKAIHAVERMAESISGTAESHAENTARLETATRSIEAAASGFGEMMKKFSEDLKELPQTLTELKDSSASSVEMLEHLLPIGERAVAGLDVSVAAFRSAVESQFVDAAKMHRTAIEELSTSVGRINESTSHLKTGSADLQETVNAHSRSFKAVNDTMQRQVLPAHEAFGAVMSQLKSHTDQFLQMMDRIGRDVTAGLDRMKEVAPDAAETIAEFSTAAYDFCEAVQQQFTPAAAQHKLGAEALNAAVGDIRSVSQTLSSGARGIESALSAHAGHEKHLADVERQVGEAAHLVGRAGESLEQSLVAEFGASKTALLEAVETLNSSAGDLASFVKSGLGPVTDRLAMLDQTLSRLEGTVQSLQNLSNAQEPIDRLTSSLAQAATISEAIAGLPEQIREILERAVEQKSNHTRRNPVSSWLGLGRHEV